MADYPKCQFRNTFVLNPFIILPLHQARKGKTIKYDLRQAFRRMICNFLNRYMVSVSACVFIMYVNRIANMFKVKYKIREETETRYIAADIIYKLLAIK